MHTLDDEIARMEQLGLRQRAEAAQSWNWDDWGKSSSVFLKGGKARKEKAATNGIGKKSYGDINHNEAKNVLALAVVPKKLTVVASTSYGKGKILRRTPDASKQLHLPRSRPGPVVPLEDAVRTVAWLEDGQLEAVDLAGPGGGEKAWWQLRTCHPVHLRNTNLIGADLGEQASLANLETMFEAGPQVRATVCIGDTENVFRECDPDKNPFGGFYHVREPRCKVDSLDFRGAARFLRQWKGRGIMFKVPIRQLLTKDSEDDFELRSTPACPSALHEVLDDSVDWEWLEALQRRHRLGKLISTDLEIGGRNGLLPAQYSIYDRFLTQVKGVRRLVIIDPKHSFSGMYPYPVHHPYDGHSMVDWERPDQQMWPLCGAVRGRVCVLQPGDTLFVPSCWWVHQQLKGDENLTLSFTLGVGYRVRPHPAIALRVSRLVEELLGELQGPQRILYWLTVMGKEEEEGVVDVDTVAGYEQIVAIWEARDEVEAVMGRRAWKDLFPRMCVGRLRATPWLNKEFKEPLYLMDKPRQIADTRNDEQRRYPELFRHAQC